MNALPMPRRARWRIAAGLLALGGVLVVMLMAQRDEPAARAPAAQATPATPTAPGVASPAGLWAWVGGAAQTAASAARPAAQVEAWLYEQGSLRASLPDGGWRVDAAGQLQPDLALRRRFDHLLSATGEATLEELGELLRLQSARELPAGAVLQVLDLWQRYLELQRHRFRQNADLYEPTSWQAALDERVRVRRELLGPAWADAFYLAEETALRAHISARDGRSPKPDAQTTGNAVALGDAAGASPPFAGLPSAARRPAAGEDTAVLQQQRIAEFGHDAARRLQEEDAEQTRWEQRIADARLQINRIRQAPELSAIQRDAAVAEELDRRFQGNERLRARALLDS